MALTVIIGYIVVLAVVLTWATAAGSGAASSSMPAARTAAPEKVQRCPSAKRAVRFYSRRLNEWRVKMGASASPRRGRPRSQGHRQAGAGCPRYLAHVLQRKAYALRREFERWWQLVTTDPDVAIEYVFGEYAEQAKNVAGCESGDNDGDLSPHVVRAHNGQYLGMFQMGSFARSAYGHSSRVLGQVVAAFRYFVASGRDWSPWSCKPW